MAKTRTHEKDQNRSRTFFRGCLFAYYVLVLNRHCRDTCRACEEAGKEERPEADTGGKRMAGMYTPIISY